jgi:competence protein ComEC
VSNKVHFLNVGLADCTIIEMDNDLVVIDCGYRRTGYSASKPTNIKNYLNDVIGKTIIDLLIVTHPHHDHFIGMEDMIGSFKVLRYWGSPYERRYADASLSNDEWNEYVKLRNKLVPESNRQMTPYKGETIKIGSCTFFVVGPRNNVNSDNNRECHDASLVVWVSSPSNTLLVCGDASDLELKRISLDYKLSDCTILRASHHGSENGADLDFLKSISPRDTIISTQSGIIENLPSGLALSRYKEYSKKTFRTDIDGTCTAPLASS